MSTSEWFYVLGVVKQKWDILNDWERELVEECWGLSDAEITQTQKDMIGDIYYERVVSKIPGGDRQKES